MLLIGSRALRHHFPDFRQPVDWDLVGTRADEARLAQVLPRQGRQSKEKVHFKYGAAMVELVLIEEVPYWEKVSRVFEDEPSVEDPILGRMHVAPASFLMLTKQCGLIYRIVHWHKNMEDFIHLRSVITEVPEHVAALLPDAQENSREMFASRHVNIATEPWSCHPKVTSRPAEPLHAQLHDRLKLGLAPARESADAWRGFPNLRGEQRIDQMRRVLAEEAVVLAAEIHLNTPLQAPAHAPATLERFALRALIVSALPEPWRYFGVNHYQEIMALIPDSWRLAIDDLEYLRPSLPNECVSADALEIAR